MTDQPKPTPGPWQPFRSLTCGHLRAGHNPRQDPRAEWTDADIELIARAPELQQRVDELEKALDFRVKYTNAQKGAIETITADLRTASDQVEAMSKDLADHKQLIVKKNRDLDTMTQENQRLRELLRSIYDDAQTRPTKGGTTNCVNKRLIESINNAIGRTGGVAC